MKRHSQLSSASQVVASIVLIGLLMFSAPALVGFVGEARAADTTPVSLNLQPVADAGLKVPQAVSDSVDLTASQPKQSAPIPVVKRVASKSVAQAYTSKPKASATRTAARTTTRSTKSSGGELAKARAILASMIARYPILAGSTVSIGKTPGGYQAVAYYKSGRILISTTHTASLDRIIRHEAWHIIDWRDNGRIDWGENVPRS